MGGEGFAAAPLGVPRSGRRGCRHAVLVAQPPAAENPAMTRASAASFVEFLARIPKIVLFGIAALVQIALLIVMIMDRAQILRDGREVKLQTRLVDPRDLLRG